ncbi:L-asparaginase type I [Trinorchestia longiramus]|nr:L-asparaginase type I [Trinorchestia longiramus]
MTSLEAATTVSFPGSRTSESVGPGAPNEGKLKKSLAKHRSSLEVLAGWHWQESRVLIFYTGGTIGMTMNPRGKLVPTPGELEARIRKYPHMHDQEYATERFSLLRNPPLVLPDCREKRRVVYWVYEYVPLLDSSNMTMDDWIRIAQDIQVTYEDFDGFVVLHGTDTLSYTAAALSFMLENLGKPVVITGSQIPLFETRSDGRDNFIGSVIMAGSYNIPEVTVFFNNKLYRGNRTTKVSTGRLSAFDSPNFPALASAGISINVEYRNIFRSTVLSKFSVFSKLDPSVGLLRIFPSISCESVKAFLNPVKGAVLQTYGSGNIPSNRTDIVEVLQKAAQDGVLIINITQCMHGGVESIYETGEALETAGIVMGLDMTPEAALAKLSYVLAKDLDFETKKKMMKNNLRGEMTVLSNSDEADTDEKSVDDIITHIAHALEMASVEEQMHLQEVLIPTLFMNAVVTSDLKRMECLSEHVVDINQRDATGTTYLHVAACNGSLEVIEWLMLHGAVVHVRDANGFTPLWTAVTYDQTKVIDLLVQTGAHLTELPTKVAEELVSSAATNNVRRIKSFVRAGADIDQPDTLGRTALHAACISGVKKAVCMLLEHGASVSRPDKVNMTAPLLARAAGHEDLAVLCEAQNQ